MLRSKPDSINIQAIKLQIENGELKVPQFQRDFVWSIGAAAELMDSVVKGYPIGAFTFWKTKDRLRTIKNIGGCVLPSSPSNDFVNYVLDGQQRITSIYATISGVSIGNNDYSKMYVDLSASENESLIILNIDNRNESEYISIMDLLNGDIKMLVERYGNYSTSLERIDTYKNRINTYSFSVIELQEAPLEIATEIFTRINTTGKSLSLFEIMCAKTYDENLNFDLFEKRQEQIEKWTNVNYDTLPHQTALQALAMCVKKSCKRKDILAIDKTTFIEAWGDVDIAFDKAIDYLKSSYHIPVSKLLPYDALMIPMVYYFYHKKKKPVGNDAKMLQDYFWRCVLSRRFTEGVESKLTLDCNNVIDDILKGNKTNEKFLEPIDVTFSSIKKNGYFSLSSAYIKGLICVLAGMHPKSFIDDSTVVIDNAWLSQTNSKNYHHFFPKAYMKNYQSSIAEDLVNHIANITIVDGYLNKNIIRDKSPSEYMNDFKIANKNLKKTMETHLIDIDNFGIWSNDFSLFFEERIKKIRKELKKRIIIRDCDNV